MFTVRRWLLAATLLNCAAASTGAALVNVVPLDHPLARAGGTTPNDIDAGRVVGTYFDTAGVNHAFVYDNGQWTTLDHPEAARGTSAFGVFGNLVCGTFVDEFGQTHGYLYDGATWTTLDHPAIGIGRPDTFARGVSGDTVVGYVIEGPLAQGFRYSGGVFTDLVKPGALGTFPTDIDDGRVVGNFDDALGTHGFVFDGTNWLALDHPLGIPLGTFVTGVDGPNVVGNYVNLLDSAGHSFLYDGASFDPIDVAGARDTTVNGIDGAQVVGVFSDDAGISHGFIATVPEPSSSLAAVVLLPLAGARRFGRGARAAPAYNRSL